MAAIALLPHGSTNNDIAALVLMLHLTVWFDGRAEVVHAGAGGPHVCHADGPQGGGACHSQSSSQGQHLHGTSPTPAMIAMQACALCMDTCFYSSFACSGRQTCISLKGHYMLHQNGTTYASSMQL